MNKKKYIIVSLVLLIIIAIVISLVLLLKPNVKTNKTIANGIVLSKEHDNYESKIITSYSEYESITKEYGSNVVLFTNNDFEENDYLVDFINYDDNLVLSNVNVVLQDDGIVINYTVNEKIDDSDKYLMYFIPIKKNLINKNVLVKSRSFITK